MMRRLLLVAIATSPACADVDRLGQKSLCSSGDFRICAAFETDIQAPLAARLSGTTTSVEIDNTRAVRGTGSLHAIAPPDPAGAYMAAQVADTQAAMTDPPIQWIRVFAFIEEASQYQSNLFEAQVPRDPNGITVQIMDGGDILVRSYRDGAVSSFDTATRMDSGRWTCFELHVSPTDQVEVFVDGDRLPHVDLPAGAAAPGLTQAALGPSQIRSSGPIAEAWFDELAVTETRIGCDR